VFAQIDLAHAADAEQLQQFGICRWRQKAAPFAVEQQAR